MNARSSRYETPMQRLRRERDEAFAEAHEARIRLGQAQLREAKRDRWLQDRKSDLGVSWNTSFDVLWAAMMRLVSPFAVQEELHRAQVNSTPYETWRVGDTFQVKRVAGARKTYRVTDIGARVVVAIEVTPERARRGWLLGPPFPVEENVFDEEDQKAMVRVV